MKYVDPSGHFGIGIVIGMIIGAVGTTLLTGCDSDDDMDSKIQYDVPLYEQSDRPMCWAYSQVMIEAYHNKKNYTQEEADNRVKEIAIEKYGKDNWERGGRPSNLGEKTSLFELDGIQSLKNILDKNGPVYAEYSNYKKGEEYEGHMVVVTGVDVANDEIYTNNPWGNNGEQSYEEFLNGFDTGFLGGDANMTWTYIYVPE